MNAKHQFKYTYTDTDIEEISPVDVTFDMPGEVTITQMLFNFECYLKACGFVFDGRLEMVEDGYENYLDELDGSLYEFDEEPQGGCMADFDKECGCKDNTKWEEEGQEKLNEWNEGLAKLEREVKKNKYKDYNSNNVGVKTEKNMWDKVAEVAKQKWVHGICNPPSPDWKAQNKNK